MEYYSWSKSKNGKMAGAKMPFDIITQTMAEGMPRCNSPQFACAVGSARYSKSQGYGHATQSLPLSGHLVQRSENADNRFVLVGMQQVFHLPDTAILATAMDRACKKTSPLILRDSERTPQ